MTPDRWLAAAGLAIGIISVALAVYFYRRTDRRRTPTFVVNPARKSLVQTELSKFEKFSLSYEGKEVGRNGITSLQVFFWNSGSLEILSSHVLRPYSISISDGRILSWSIIKTNRGVIQPELVRANDKSNSLCLSFAVLEPGDGAVIEIVYDGPPVAKVEIDGVCVGSQKPTVLPSDPVYFSTRSKQFLDAYTPLLMALLMVSTLFPIFGGAFWLVHRLFGEKPTVIVFFVVSGCILTLPILAFIAHQYSSATNKYVPHDIRPD